jgi:hypothetical protein
MHAQGFACRLDPVEPPIIVLAMTATFITPAHPNRFREAAGAFHRSLAEGRPLRAVRDALIAAWLVLLASAVVYADEHLQDWIPDILTMPDDAEVVTDRAIGSTVRMFSIATDADIDALFAEWEAGLNETGYPVMQGADDVLDQSIEFSGPGIANAKIIVAPTTDDGRTIIEFDATLN